MTQIFIRKLAKHVWVLLRWYIYSSLTAKNKKTSPTVGTRPPKSGPANQIASPNKATPTAVEALGENPTEKLRRPAAVAH